jgi:uncharacterized protein
MKQIITNFVTKLKTVRPLYIILIITVTVVLVSTTLIIINTIKSRQKAEIQKETTAKQQINITRQIKINNKTLIVDVADTPQARIKGLMGKTSLAPDTGMIFTFGNESAYTFWMKNMKMSIDMIWINKDMNIVDMDSNVPPCSNDNCELYTPNSPVKYVIETSAGWATANNIKIGDKIEMTGIGTTQPAQ